MDIVALVSSLNEETLLLNKSVETFVKHFLSKSQYSWSGDYSMRDFTSGYFNTTSAINAIQFKMSS